MPTFGEMPPLEAFIQHVEPLWPTEGVYRMTLRGLDAKVGQACGLPSFFDTPKQVYGGVEDLLRYASEDIDPEMSEGAQSLASSIMQTLGYEWL